MADPRFFDNAGPLTLTQIEQLTGAKLTSEVSNLQVRDVAPIDNAASHHLSFCESIKFSSALSKTGAGAVFVTKALAHHAPKGTIIFESSKPSLAFATIANALYPSAHLLWPRATPPTFAIAPSARAGEGTVIAPGAFIGENVEIGDCCIIGPGSVIGRGVTIGHHTVIGAHVSISHTMMGDRCIVHSGARIGQDGFGFVNGPSGHYKIPQLGRVIIQDNVEIGSNCTIDRGALADTVIGEGTKIDNLVQIGHNTKIGRNCIIVSQGGISGSCEIEDFVVLGGQVGVADHVKIGKGTFVAGRGGVTRSLDAGKVYGGFPARPVEQWRREVGIISRLAKGTRPKDE